MSTSCSTPTCSPNTPLTRRFASLLIPGLAFALFGFTPAANAQGSDDCSAAAGGSAISGTGTFAINTAGATTGAPLASCGLMTNDVWFHWTATANGPHTVTLCGGATVDTVMAVWDDGAPSGNCPTTQVVCGDDSGCGLQSQVSFTAVSGTKYFIEIGSYSGDPTFSGSFSISGPPANDECATPTAISGTGLFAFNQVGATTGTQGQAETACNFFSTMAVGNDVWFAWTAPSTGIATVETCGQTTVDTKIAAYAGGACPSAAALDCSDDDCGATFQSRIQFVCQAGSVYLLQVGTYPSSTGGTGNLNISVGPPQVKLSQIYGSGGNTQAPISNDYIEIYNAGPVAQPLTGWSVQYASSSGTTWAVTSLPAVTLAPGQYLLVQEAAGTIIAPQVPALPTPQATFTTAMSGTDFKVALVSSTTALVGGTPTYAGSPTLIDLVGAGTLANWNDASAAGAVQAAANNAPAASTAYAIYRRGCGSQDTNDSKEDWAVGFPAPRNTSTALNGGITVIGTALPMTVEVGQSSRITATPFRCGTIDLGAGTTVSIDLTLLGGAPTAMLDNGTGGDEVAGDGIFTVLATVGGSATTGTKNLPLTVSDGGGNTGGGYMNMVVEAAATPDNDNCYSAQAVAAPSSTAGNFTGATVESNPFASFGAAPTTGMGSRRGLWYTVTGTGNTMTASLCATVLDSVMAVMCGTCDGFTVIATGDDAGPACAGSSASAAWCSQLGTTYYIWVAPFAAGANTTAFTLDVTDSGVACTTAFPCTTCTGVAGPFTEAEPGYGIHNNDGCATTPNRFTDIAAPSFPATTLRGTARGMIGNRDVDSYRFLATTTGLMQITINTLGTNAQAQLVSLSAGGTCPQTAVANTSLFVTRCATGIQTMTTTVTAGTWYAINVVGGIGIQVTPAATVFGGQMPGGTTYQYEMSVSIGGPPPNDACASAATLALNTTVGGTTDQATNDGTSSCDATGRDVWYTLTTTSTGTLTIHTQGSAIDTVVSLLSACGGSEISCNDDCASCLGSGTFSCLTIPAFPAGTYTVRVSDKNIGTGGSFSIRASLDVVGNDTCCNATTLAVPSVTSGTTVGATAESPLPPACAGPLPGGAQSFTVTTSQGVWYQVISPVTQTISADTFASAYDSRIFVYDGSAGCASLVCVTANDDAVGSPFQSRANWVATAGVPYYLLVTPFSTTTGAFTLTLTGDATPANNDCGSPTVVTGYSGSMAGTTVGATAVNNTATGANPSCNPSYSMFDVWYSWTAPCDGNATIATCGAFDTVLSVHTTCPTLTTNNQIAGACNDNGAVGCTPGSSLTLAVTSGTTYLVRVASALNATTGGAFTLTWAMPDADLDGTADCIDGCPNDPLKIAPGICGCGVSDADTDGDGTVDCNDLCPLDPLKIAPGICGCGVSDVDTDGDGAADCNDLCPLDPLKVAPGQCGCGIADTDTDNDGTADCNDLCPTDPLKVAPGVCGCGVADTDGDGDGVADCNDNCPAVANASQADLDGDAVGDACDNCVTLPNPAQGDCDNDNIGDACEIGAGSPDCNLNGIPDGCDVALLTSADVNSNGVPDECELNGGTPYCFGDGPTNGGPNCPCSNNSVIGNNEGCLNSAGVGAKLTGTGLTSVGADGLVLNAIQMGSGFACVFLQGDSVVSAPYGDGLRCAGGTLIRLGTKNILGGMASYPTGGDLPVSVKGLVPPAGGVRYYATFYRNNGGPCGTGYNITNGVSAIWVP